MRRKAGTVMMVFGLALVAISIFQYTEHQAKLNKALAQAEDLIENASEEFPAQEPLASSKPVPTSLMVREQFKPSDHDVIGML